MKPILIFGASISAAAMAAGFAVLANQAMPPRATEINPIQPANVAREVAPPQLARAQTPRIAARSPAPQPPLPAETAVPDAAIRSAAPVQKDAAQPAGMYLLSPSHHVTAGGLAERPVPRPALIAASAGMIDPPAAPWQGPETAARFDYIPLIGVYR